MTPRSPAPPSPSPVRGEESIIQDYLAPLAAGFPGALDLQDDCAILVPTPGHDIVLKTDPVAAGIHFMADDRPEDIGWKALAVNVSDLAAKGAVPRAYLMALSFPEAPTGAWMAGFAAGLSEAQAAFGIHLAGGDTDRRPGPISISITVLGEVPTGRMVRRATAHAGDVLYVTGTLGDAALGLKLRQAPDLAAQWGIGPLAVACLVGRYLRPQPRLALRPALLAHARAAMDLSDGLAKDLGRMARASSCGATVALADLPLCEAARSAVQSDPLLWQSIAAGGDDYEVLLAVPPEAAGAFEQAVEAIDRQEPRHATRLAVTRIGLMTTGPDVRLLAADGRPIQLDRPGWDHF